VLGSVHQEAKLLRQVTGRLSRLIPFALPTAPGRGLREGDFLERDQLNGSKAGESETKNIHRKKTAVQGREAWMQRIKKVRSDKLRSKGSRDTKQVSIAILMQTYT
jgi:hypothetical protein